MVRSISSSFIALLALVGCGDDSIRDVRGIWSGDGSDRIAVVVQRYDTKSDPTFGDVGREFAVNHSWELWTINRDGSDAKQVADRAGIAGRVFFFGEAGYATMLWHLNSQTPVVIDTETGERSFPETGDIPEALVPSPAGTNIAIVEGLLPGADNIEHITATYPYRFALLDSSTLEVVTESFIGLEVSDALSGWVSEDEFRYGTVAMFRDGRIQEDVSAVSEACHHAATPGSEVNRDGQRLVVDYDGDDFEINVVSDGLPWPERCTP